jgi:hypothetical protein
MQEDPVRQDGRSDGPAPAGPVDYEAVVPNPKAKLIDQVREVLRLKHLIRLAPARLTPLGL